MSLFVIESYHGLLVIQAEDAREALETVQSGWWPDLYEIAFTVKPVSGSSIKVMS